MCLGPLLIAHAANQVVVIPMSGKDLEPLKNIITVAKENGDFTDPVAAVNAIPTSGADMPTQLNPYLIVIAPGVYDITSTGPLQMKEWVDIAGSGPNVTVIGGNISNSAIATSTIIIGSNNSTISNLSIQNAGSGNNSIGIYLSYADAVIKDVHCSAMGGTANNNALYNSHSDSAISRVWLLAQSEADANATAFFNRSSSPTVVELSAVATGLGLYNTGVHNQGSAGVMTQVSAKASFGTTNYAVMHSSSATTLMVDVDAEASDGTTNYGAYVSGSSATFRRSTLSGTTKGLRVKSTGTIQVSQSTLISGAEVEAGSSATCIATDNNAGALVATNCL